MSFRFYSNAISQASRNLAAGIFIVGMLLIGFGFLIWLLKELFAILFAGLFCVAGIGCMGTAVKIFWTFRKAGKTTPNNDDRENVRIHNDHNQDDVI
ncbi:hypothetical protein ACFL3G_01670 [Planctomycetota bacterium]